MAVTPNSIVTPQAVKSAAAMVSTANTTFSTSPANTVRLLTSGVNGARVTRLIAIPVETVTANFLQIYRSKDSGITKYLCAGVTGGSDTVSGSDAPSLVDFGFSESNPMLLEADEEIYVATGISKTYHFTAEYADF